MSELFESHEKYYIPRTKSEPVRSETFPQGQHTFVTDGLEQHCWNGKEEDEEEESVTRWNSTRK